MKNYQLRFVPLGGIVGVTKNMYLYELYQDNQLKDILIIDCGIGFPQEKELGVDFAIPDISYLEDKKDKIRALILTHGHEDHTSALPLVFRISSSKVLPTTFSERVNPSLSAPKQSERRQKTPSLPAAVIFSNSGGWP